MQRVAAGVRKNATLIGVVLIAIGIVAVFIGTSKQLPAQPMTSDLLLSTEGTASTALLVEETSEPTAIPATPTASPIVVYISGAIQTPDVYQLPPDARVKDLVVAAGGLAENADPDQINLAAHLADGQHVYVPHQGEGTTHINEGEGTTGGTNVAASGSNALIDINTANAAELESLPGIGESFAQRIIAYRSTNGPFKSIEDLQKVKGIGPTRFAQIAPRITVGP